MIEIWKDINEYIGRYQISNFGNVRSLERTVCNGKGHKLLSESILKYIYNYKGYGTVYLSKESSSKCFMVHRLVAIHFIDNPYNKSEVNHKNGIKDCNYTWNLEWVTSQENSKHAVETGLRKVPCGENSKSSILKEKQVIEILDLYKQGNISQNKLSQIYDVSEAAIHHIIKRKNWKHLNYSLHEN